MKLLFMKIGKILMRFIYAFFKLIPTQNKVVFLSRQYNEAPIDFVMLNKEILDRNPQIRTWMICERINTTPKGILKLVVTTLRSMYHVATARVAILDTYSPVISLLNHKQELTVIQIWHAMGKIKKSGYSNLDTTEAVGRSSKVAKIMNMHQGYDMVVAGAKAWNPFYCESFGIKDDIIYNVGLPRIDYILQNSEILKQKMFSLYPGLKHKPIVVYAPTHRKNDDEGCAQFIKEFDFDQFNLIVKSHPNQKLNADEKRVYTFPTFETIECLAIADYLVTDYSGISIEAAALDVKTFYYLYDYEYYTIRNGVNIDLFKEMEGAVFLDSKSVINALKSEYPSDQFAKYKQKFLPDTIGKSTRLIVEKIIAGLEG